MRRAARRGEPLSKEKADRRGEPLSKEKDGRRGEPLSEKAATRADSLKEEAAIDTVVSAASAATMRPPSRGST